MVPLPGDQASATSDEGRASLAQFILSRERQIRALAARKLTPSTRSVFDSEDVMASVLRRVDDLARNGRLRPGNESELWGLVQAIATNTALNKTRLIARFRKWLAEDSDYAHFFMGMCRSCSDDDEITLVMYRLAAALDDRTDRQVFLLRLRGASHRAVAGVLETSEEAARKRWERICQQLREQFASEVSP